MKDIRQLMIEDMKLRGLTPSTQATYLEAVKVLARHYNCQLCLISHRSFSINQPISPRAISNRTNLSAAHR